MKSYFSLSQLSSILVTTIIIISISYVYAIDNNKQVTSTSQKSKIENIQKSLRNTTKRQPIKSGNVGTASNLPRRVYLPSISTLTFLEHTYTTPIRSVPQMQLECVGGNAKDETERYPTRVDCFNQGVEQVATKPHVRWKCITPLHRGVKITDWKIHCEGWSSPSDFYVVDGSCWLEYKLVYDTTYPSGIHPIPDGSETQRIRANVNWILEAIGASLIVITCIWIPLKLVTDARRNDSDEELIPILHPNVHHSSRSTPPTSRSSSRNASPAIRPRSSTNSSPQQGYRRLRSMFPALMEKANLPRL